MTDPELLAALHDFGVDAPSREALVFLPVVWVAWADGTVQPEERSLILELAGRHVALGVDGRRRRRGQRDRQKQSGWNR